MQDELSSDEKNTKYFKSNYELFDERKTSMIWGLKSKEELSQKFKSITDDIYDKEKNKENILIFCDLIYYHDTCSKNIRKSICESYNMSIEDIRKLKIEKDLKENVKKMIDAHIEILEPKLIVVTNALALQLICSSLKEEYN